MFLGHDGCCELNRTRRRSHLRLHRRHLLKAQHQDLSADLFNQHRLGFRLSTSGTQQGQYHLRHQVEVRLLHLLHQSPHQTSHRLRPILPQSPHCRPLPRRLLLSWFPLVRRAVLPFSFRLLKTH